MVSGLKQQYVAPRYPRYSDQEGAVPNRLGSTGHQKKDTPGRMIRGVVVVRHAAAACLAANLDCLVCRSRRISVRSASVAFSKLSTPHQAAICATSVWVAVASSLICSSTVPPAFGAGACAIAGRVDCLGRFGWGDGGFDFGTERTGVGLADWGGASSASPSDWASVSSFA